MKPGDKLIRRGKPEEVFTVDAEGRFAVRSFGPLMFNPVDKEWYHSQEFIDLVNGGSFVLQPVGPKR